MINDFHILLIEDSPTDAQIVGRALREGRIPHRLTLLSDGAEALDYLDRLLMPETPTQLYPSLVLLDLNLPGPDGVQVLARIKGEPALKAIPVIVLTTSQRDEDVWRIYQGGANTYVAKPGDYPSYRRLVDLINEYWQNLAQLPPRRPPGD